MPPSNFWQNEKLVSRKGRVLWLDGKGQLISKGLFGILNSSKKTNKKIRLCYYDTSGRLVFIRFLGEIEDTKKIFRN